jgi:hypothetical protein
MRLHIRLLWGLFDAKNIPKLPEEKMLTKFKKRFLTEESLEDFQSREPLVAISLVKVTSTKLGKIGSQLALIEEHIISYIQGCLARFGMTSWGPDLRETAYSLYNSACRIIALDTFKQALVSHAYASTRPNLKYAKDMALLIKIYDHIVHQYFYSRWRRDIQRPGSVAAEDETNPAYKARNRVSFIYRSSCPS